MGKTDTINDRRVDVYLDSIEQKAQWVETAEESDMSLSNFVQACVEYTIEQGGPDFLEAGSSAGEMQDLRDTLRERKATIEEKDMVIEDLRTELKRYRAEPFLDEDFEGQRAFDQDLVEVLQHGGAVTADTLLRELNIDAQNVELREAIQNQLEQLKRYGLVKETVHGWTWEG